MVKPIPMMPIKKPKSLDFEGLIEAGQNPRGFTAQTANGTAKSGNSAGWNRQYDMGPMPEVEATGAWTQANRTGE